jgi:hypothetical protein
MARFTRDFVARVARSPHRAPPPPPPMVDLWQVYQNPNVGVLLKTLIYFLSLEHTTSIVSFHKGPNINSHCASIVDSAGR